MLIFGIDKFMSECRALTNMIGNSVATLVVAKWEGVFDRGLARAILARRDEDEFAVLAEDLEPLAPAAVAEREPARV